MDIGRVRKGEAVVVDEAELFQSGLMRGLEPTKQSTTRMGTAGA